MYVKNRFYLFIIYLFIYLFLAITFPYLKQIFMFELAFPMSRDINIILLSNM